MALKNIYVPVCILYFHVYNATLQVHVTNFAFNVNSF